LAHLWHVSLAWLLWWVRRPLFIARYRMLEAGMEEELITPQDRKIAKIALVAVPVLVLAFNAMTISEYPNTIPLQAGLDQILPLPAQVNAGVVNVETLKAEYRVAERAMKFALKIDNQSEHPVLVSVGFNEWGHTFWFREEFFAAPIHWGFVIGVWFALGVGGILLQGVTRLIELLDQIEDAE
jgi:hypothetical protein